MAIRCRTKDQQLISKRTLDHNFCHSISPSSAMSHCCHQRRLAHTLLCVTPAPAAVPPGSAVPGGAIYCQFCHAKVKEASPAPVKRYTSGTYTCVCACMHASVVGCKVRVHARGGGGRAGTGLDGMTASAGNMQVRASTWLVVQIQELGRLGRGRAAGRFGSRWVPRTGWLRRPIRWRRWQAAACCLPVGIAKFQQISAGTHPLLSTVIR